MKDNLISTLSEIRSNYNCFNESEEPYYRALSEAIKKLSERVDGDAISRETAIDALYTEIIKRRLMDDVNDGMLDEFDTESILRKLPSAQPEQQWIPCSDPSNLPKDERLWITREISDGFFTLREVSDVIWDMTEWSGSVSNVVAYMPYWEPEPYTERREE